MLGTVLLNCLVSSKAQTAAPYAAPVVATAFGAASTAYDRGDYAKASSILEALAPRTPQSFDVQELLGLSYAAQSQTAVALEHLRAAVALRPDLASARVNLATGLIRSGEPAKAEGEYKKALELDRLNYDANRYLARLYLNTGHPADAIALLNVAQSVHPIDDEVEYDLALAYFLGGRLGEAKDLAEKLLRKGPSGDLHNLAAQVAEKQGRYMDAVNEFAAAAYQEPTEENLFAWGTELLSHRTYVPAISVFRSGVNRYPDSARMLVGLGMALYARGDFDESVRVLLRGADASPSDPRCYLYLSRAYLSSPTQAAAAVERFRRYAELEPKNARAQFYYGMSLWQGSRQSTSPADYGAIGALLSRAVELDDTLAEAHLQLGILYSDQHEYEKSMQEYERALELDPGSPEVHFRMGRYYLHVGMKDKAATEFASFKRLQEQQHAAEDKAKASVQQFVVAVPAVAPARQ